MNSDGVGGSDESFISFAFAIVSLAMILMYFPWAIRKIHGIYTFYTSKPKGRSTVTNPLVEFWESLTYLPILIYKVACEPNVLVAGAKVCFAEKIFFFRCVMPKFLKFIIRPKILILWLWVLLFSSAMYVTLTFDAHGILGIPQSASPNDIKKAYRALSRRFHPDHNKTEGAREIYFQIRRAYKALVDRDAFEEEEKNTGEFSVGIALPRFLTSREHDGLVLFGLLTVLIGVPAGIWYYFMRGQTLPSLIWRIRFDKERVVSFWKHFGIPEDPKFKERAESRRRILETLQSIGIASANAREDLVADFPPFPDFIDRCLDLEKNKGYLTKLGIKEPSMPILHTYMAANGIKLLDEYDRFVATLNAESQEIQLLSLPAYKATRFLFHQHVVQVDAALAQLQEQLSGALSSARKLSNLHEEMYQLLDAVYTSDKSRKLLLPKLIAIPQRVQEIVDSIEPEIESLYRRSYKNFIFQQAKTKQDLKALKQMIRKGS